MAVLEVKELTKIYGSGDNQVKALDHVSFRVKKGEFVAVVGASGSGKSTLMNLIGGIDRPTSGSVIIEGKEIFGMNESELAIFRRRNIGIVYQFYNLIPNLTVDENIMLPCLLDKREPDRKKLEQIIEMTGLSHRRTHLPGELSGGQQQRAAIARSLIYRPALILADEPTGNLDQNNSKEIMDMLKLSNRNLDQTILLITHDEKAALEAERVITVEDGRIISDERRK